MIRDLPGDVVAVVQVPALLSVRSVAELLDLSDRTIRRRIDEGELPAVREHDRTMIRADELAAYIDRLERVGQPRGRKRHASPRRGNHDWLR